MLDSRHNSSSASESQNTDATNTDANTDNAQAPVFARVTLPPVELGQVLATPGALEALASANMPPIELLRRHAGGDWGEVDAHDRAENDRARLEGTRLLSAYTLPTTNEKVWIITEWDRSVTTLLLPSEY